MTERSAQKNYYNNKPSGFFQHKIVNLFFCFEKFFFEIFFLKFKTFKKNIFYFFRGENVFCVKKIK